MRVGLFVPCYVDAFHPDVGIATLELLERFGIEVEYPFDQTCCGQPMTKQRLRRGIRCDCSPVRS
jgi:L-lactate dehydrogenase complex protein LldE